MKEAIRCINCSHDAYWCDSKPDEDGDMHECDHISCDHCGMHYTLVSEESHNAESFEEMKNIMRKVYHGIDYKQL